MMLIEGQKDFLVSIGSSNWAQRSFSRDNELNFYVYSDSMSFKRKVDKELDLIKRDCKELNPAHKKGGLKSLIFDSIVRYNELC